MKLRGGSVKPRKPSRAVGRKPRKAPAARPSVADLQRQLDQRTRDRDEALEQQAAAAEILSLISNSPTDTQPVFKTMLAKAVELCGASFGAMWLVDGKGYRTAAMHGDLPRAYVEQWRSGTLHLPKADIPMVRAMRSRKTVHTQDMRKERAYLQGDPLAVSSAEVGGIRTLVTVPMLKGGEAVGVIAIYRREVLPFTARQVELVESFAAQAVIAIENTRLVNELRESLDQQTATSRVLQGISRSTFDLQTVFDTLVESAARLCRADKANMFRLIDGQFKYVAFHGFTPEYAEYMRTLPTKVHRGSVIGRAVLEAKIVHIHDVLADPEFSLVDAQKRGDFRTALGVPLMREGTPVGAFFLSRAKVEPFTQQQINLVTTFADQAVIAIENVRLFEAEQQSTRELTESLEQQTATAEVLSVISSSPGELDLVFRAMLERATRVCGANFGVLFRYEGGLFHPAASLDVPPAFADFLGREGSFAPKPGQLFGRLRQSKTVIHVVDRATEPNPSPSFRYAGARSSIAVPMLKENELVGAFFIYRTEVRPFTEKQIELVQNFAAQAVIAIENSRLLNELRDRTTDLAESLEQQTATSEVLKVISSSTSDLQAVFDTMAENAVRVCEAERGYIFRFDGEFLRAVASYNAGPENREFVNRNPIAPGRQSVSARAALERRTVQVPDIQADPEYAYVIRDVEPIRTTLAVPMVKGDDLVGTITIYRLEVKPFTDKQVALVETFADQAVIAIENARLLNELRQSLEQQTATADVLRVISSSPTDVQPVFDSIAESAVRLCGGQFSFVVRFDGKVMNYASCFGLSAEGLGVFRGIFPLTAGDDTVSGRAILQRAIVEVPDVEVDGAYGVQAQRLARTVAYRSIVAVPLLHEGDPIGAIAVARANAGSFPERQIALLQAFADQAVIAIRNVRLFDEVQARTEELSASLQQQTATADVLKVISRSTFDLQTVLQTLVESAARFCAADKATIVREKDGGFYTAEAYGYSREFLNYMRNIPIKAERGSASGRALVEGRVIHIADVNSDPEYTFVEARRLGDFRTVLCVPMLREGIPIGVLILTRSEVQPFTDKQIELVTTLADQASIAIENVQLFDEIQDKSRQLEVVSQHKSQFLANMSHELRTPLNAILGYTELMTDGAYGEPSEKMQDVLKRLEANGRHLLGLINDVLDLSKIEAGQLELELSDYSVQDIAQTVRSTLEPLAADKKLAFKLEMPSELPPGHGDGRRLTQVLINLVGNAIKFTDAGEVAIRAEANNGSFYVAVRDTGPGISAANQAKLFQEFQQADNAITRKKGGTGLGLAISKRIIEMHGGRIWVESQPGQGSKFTFTLPVVVEQQVNVEPK
jgi:GAF domain-containing protein